MEFCLFLFIISLEISSSMRSCRLFTPKLLQHARLYSIAPPKRTWAKWEYMNPIVEQTDDNSDEITYNKTPEKLWATLSDDQVKMGIEALSIYVNTERQAKLHEIMDQRTDNVRFVFENPGNVNNMWAALRTFDSFGIQNIDIIMDKVAYEERWGSGKSARGKMNSAMGTQKWLTLNEYETSEKCVSYLKSEGYLVFATDVNAESVSLYAFNDVLNDATVISGPADGDGDEQEQQMRKTRTKIAIVMGNELEGVSETMKKLADYTFYIPMKGFAESFNVSAASAIICSSLERDGLLPQNMRNCPAYANRLYLTWLSRSVNKSMPILRRHGIPVEGNSIYQTILSVTTKP